jgi:omega-6 fatty acid desaturase (delta-12 desaturase)
MGKLGHPQAGGFPLMTVADYREASRWERLVYRISRHPLTIATAGVTIFLWSMTLAPLFESWSRHWDSLTALLLHAGCVGLLWWLGGPATAFFAIILPYLIASALGAYLFFVQHNFPGMMMLTEEEWTTEKAAVVSSSHLDLGLIMRWFTGEIGYHHVHHLNRTIPFYRLAEAMQALPELQGSAVTITLFPRDIIACFRVALWDEDTRHMVSYAEAAA